VNVSCDVCKVCDVCAGYGVSTSTMPSSLFAFAFDSNISRRDGILNIIFLLKLCLNGLVRCIIM